MNICEALLCVCVCMCSVFATAKLLPELVPCYIVCYFIVCLSLCTGCSQYCLINLQVDRVVLNRGCPSMMGGERRREEKMSREGETESNLSIFSSPVVVFWHVKEEAFYDWIS